MFFSMSVAVMFIVFPICDAVALTSNGQEVGGATNKKKSQI